jgi:hypothetical protein
MPEDRAGETCLSSHHIRKRGVAVALGARDAKMRGWLGHRGAREWRRSVAALIPYDLVTHSIREREMAVTVVLKGGASFTVPTGAQVESGSFPAPSGDGSHATGAQAFEVRDSQGEVVGLFNVNDVVGYFIEPERDGS